MYLEGKVFPIGVRAEAFPITEEHYPVVITLSDTEGLSHITIHLTEAQADSLFSQLGKSCKEIERAKGGGYESQIEK